MKANYPLLGGEEKKGKRRGHYKKKKGVASIFLAREEKEDADGPPVRIVGGIEEQVR